MMKKVTITLTILITIIAGCAFDSGAENLKPNEGIQFFKGSWQQAVDLAKKENKFIFMDAYASWCGPCKKMKRTTFSDKLVGEVYNKNFISIAIDMEKGEGPALALKYEVDAYPTLIYFTPEGKLIGKTTGLRNAQEFIEIGESIIKPQ